MSEKNLEGLLNVSLENIKGLVDSNSIIGSPITTPDGTTIIPVSKVSFGFASGGSDYAAGAAVMETIRTTGNLDKDTEEALKGVLSAYTESFLKAH